ncbi:MAG TPA: hypothetical protein PK686_04070 [bacterium]|nr:hypothetical protein [bacterium]HPV65817.1 hypothetical protein [bacterium]
MEEPREKNIYDLVNNDNNEQLKNENNREDGSLSVLLEENIKISNEILEISKYIKKYIFFQKVMVFVKLFLILIPIILAFAFLPFLKGLVGPLQSVLSVYSGIESGNMDFLNNLNQ